MANAYANLKTIKSVSLLDIAGSSHDSRLLELLEDVSRWVDQHCNRHFFSLQTTRAFDVEGGSSRILVPDLIRITALKSDSDGDNRFETAWASGDYRLYPLNAEPNQPWGRPYSRIEVGAGPEAEQKGGPASPRARARCKSRVCGASARSCGPRQQWWMARVSTHRAAVSASTEACPSAEATPCSSARNSYTSLPWARTC